MLKIEYKRVTKNIHKISKNWNIEEIVYEYGNMISARYWRMP
ncbi:unnamed protein product, partial [marine sediment metagenome]